MLAALAIATTGYAKGSSLHIYFRVHGTGAPAQNQLAVTCFSGNPSVPGTFHKRTIYLGLHEGAKMAGVFYADHHNYFGTCNYNYKADNSATVSGQLLDVTNKSKLLAMAILHNGSTVTLQPGQTTSTGYNIHSTTSKNTLGITFSKPT
ncbi:MAG: hypothetical protein A3E81_04490 [Gammaproteobacteria bacterium RIFCSPHIGHO2_12_FULL_36_30]|nr:MAG: hypothetical protein A3E81_04490 [Gammaproteobacteria bacterium RIFCSPHIGHO2_12_FULL_36_30]